MPASLSPQSSERLVALATAGTPLPGRAIGSSPPATATLNSGPSAKALSQSVSHPGDARVVPRGARRKIAMLRRCGLFGQDTRGAVVTRACTIGDLRQAYRLVHAVFLAEGFLHAEPAGIRLRIYETAPETATFVAKVGDRVIGVLSVVGDSDSFGLPSDGAFKPELDTLRRSGRRLCEMTNQVVEAGFRNSGVPTELMRCAGAHCIQAGYNECVVSISPGHHGFYHLLGFRQIGAKRSYSPKVYDPVLALGWDIDPYREPALSLTEIQRFVCDELTERNPFLTRVGGWTRQARQQFLNPDFLRELFVDERNFLEECSREQRRILRQCWGNELFGAVAPSDEPAYAD